MEHHFQNFNNGAHAEISVLLYRHGDTNAHTHDFLELVYIVEGSALHTINGRSALVTPGDYFIVDYASQHQYQTQCGREFVLYNILFTPGFIDRALVNCHSFQQILEHYLIRFRNAPAHFPKDAVFRDEDGTVLERIRAMEREYSYQKPGFAELLRCGLIEIIVRSLRKISTDGANAAQHPCVCAILDRVNQNYMEPLTLTGLSRELNYSLPYLSRLFQEETGMRFHCYLQKKRIENSCRLLLNTHKKVSEIAELVGYSDLKSFQAAFRKLMHTTPKAYQKQNH